MKDTFLDLLDAPSCQTAPCRSASRGPGQSFTRARTSRTAAAASTIAGRSASMPACGCRAQAPRRRGFAGGVFDVLDQTYSGDELFHKRLDFPAWSNDGFDLGGIIGTAEIVDCVEASDSPWFFGPFGLVLTNVHPVPFIPVKGALGLFKWKEKMEAGE